jgi:hypothetical protein
MNLFKSKKNVSADSYYSYNTIRSYNKWLNFIISGRGGGKTYGFKKMAIRDYLKTGEQFIYLRRYETELRTKYNFFEKIEPEFPGYEFKINGEFGYIRTKDSDEKWDIICYFIPLSTAGTKYKGGDYPRVSKICFDEFIIKEGMVRYIKDEPFLLKEFYSTVDRDEDRVQVFCLGNNISLINPYFTHFNVSINPELRFNQDKTKTIVIEMFENAEITSNKKQTRFGMTCDGTDYGRYSIDNESYSDRDDFITPRPSGKSIFLLSFKVGMHELGVWQNEENSMLYVDRNFDDNSKNRYVLTREDHTQDTMVIKRLTANPTAYRIKKAADKGLVFYNNIETKKLFYFILKHLT